MAAPVLAYENLGLQQGAGWLFRDLNVFIGERDRLALIGRNGRVDWMPLPNLDSTPVFARLTQRRRTTRNLANGPMGGNSTRLSD